MNAVRKLTRLKQVKLLNTPIVMMVSDTRQLCIIIFLLIASKQNKNLWLDCYPTDSFIACTVIGYSAIVLSYCKLYLVGAYSSSGAYCWQKMRARLRICRPVLSGMTRSAGETSLSRPDLKEASVKCGGLSPQAPLKVGPLGMVLIRRLICPHITGPN